MPWVATSLVPSAAQASTAVFGFGAKSMSQMAFSDRKAAIDSALLESIPIGSDGISRKVLGFFSGPRRTWHWDRGLVTTSAVN
jgi:hypothetical protein